MLHFKWRAGDSQEAYPKLVWCCNWLVIWETYLLEYRERQQKLVSGDTDILRMKRKSNCITLQVAASDTCIHWWPKERMQKAIGWWHLSPLVIQRKNTSKNCVAFAIDLLVVPVSTGDPKKERKKKNYRICNWLLVVDMGASLVSISLLLLASCAGKFSRICKSEEF